LNARVAVAFASPLHWAVGHEAVQVDVEAQVAAKTLDHGDDAAVKRRDRGEPVLMLDRAAYVLKERSGEALRDRGEELAVVAEADGQGPREGEDPLAVADRRQNVVHEERGSLGHAPAHARRAEAAALAREGHPQLVAAAAARRPHEALREVAAHGEAAQLALDEVGERGMTAFLNAL